MNTRMPCLFVGHGNPMYAIEDSAYGRAWAALGQALPRPRAVLSVSAHWYTDRLAVTAMRQPRTIHDFGNFPRELFEVQYPAPGSPGLARQVAGLLDSGNVELDEAWGLDHGTWSVLRHVFPAADVPVVQLSIDRRQPPAWHFRLAGALEPLRDDGVMILGSGNIVHNLREFAWHDPDASPYDWAERFEATVRRQILAREFEPLIDYLDLTPDARLAVPTPDHYLPLLYVLAQHQADDPVSFPVEGLDGGSMSMLAVQLG